MNLKDIGAGALQVLRTVAPTLAATALGPFAPLAAPILQKIFGTTDAKSTEAALLTATPEQIIALRQADIAHEEFLTTAGITKDKLAYDDLANARQMQVQMKDPNVARLAWTIIGGFLTISLVQIITLVGWADQVNKIPPQGWLLIGNLSGYLANEAKQAAAFYFGTTAGSQAKDLTIADIAKAP